MTDYKDLRKGLRYRALEDAYQHEELIGATLYGQALNAIEALLKEREERLIFGTENAWQQFSPKSDE